MKDLSIILMAIWIVYMIYQVIKIIYYSRKDDISYNPYLADFEKRIKKR